MQENFSASEQRVRENIGLQVPGNLQTNDHEREGYAGDTRDRKKNDIERDHRLNCIFG
jgi:hypothetical protein